MLSWIFKKRGDGVTPDTPAASVPSVSTPAETRASQARKAEAAQAEWLPQLRSAQGDDAALLQLAQSAPVLEIKLAAVEALVAEEALKRAERAFRNRERKVHQAAKRRLESAVAQRESRARAQALIAAAHALTTEPVLALNRLVALDRDWQALDPSLLEPGQRSGFAELRDRLNASIQERGALEHRVQRWTGDATQALADLRAACVDAAVGGVADDTVARCEAARDVRAARPDEPATLALDQALEAALHTAAAVEARLGWFDAPGSSPDSVPPAPGTEPTPEPANALQRWRALPPLADAALARWLNDRFESWQRARAPVQPAAAPVRAASAAARVVNDEQRAHLAVLLQAAETTIAEGRLAGLQPHLNAVDAALAAMNGATPGDALQTRIQALEAERLRLKGWQQWGGARARDGLLAEAEQLAQLALPASDAAPAADGAPARAPKLHLKTHADAVHALRLRWKELDRTGAPAGQALWQRFDAALHTAYQPVAAQQAAQKAARAENLSVREALLATLDAAPAQPPGTPDPDQTAAHWKEQARALERFQLAWRQLGPLEHTVPAAARSALQQRLRDSVERIEAPLRDARDAAQAAREALIARAEALVHEMARQPQMRDAAQRVRELQADWQQLARTVPLVRSVEGALWGRFKAATDAVFAQREAAFGARDAELAANLVAREALVQRLAAVDPTASEGEIQRALAEAEREWRQPVDLPRAAVAAIDVRFREAHATALRSLHDREQGRREAQFDTLEAKLALCVERERSPAAADPSTWAERWAALGPLPAAWEPPLAERWAHAGAPGPLSESAMDDVLLQLEAALDLPATPERLAARRDLKLRALKEALEGRKSAASNPAAPTRALATALRQNAPTEAQRERLCSLVAALRRAPPGTGAQAETFH